jgi:hypothetical protein
MAPFERLRHGRFVEPSGQVVHGLVGPAPGSRLRVRSLWQALALSIGNK